MASKDKKLRLSLAAKGLLLLAVPLCCEITFVLLLTHFQHEADAESVKAREARDISDRINKLSGDFYVAVRALGVGKLSRWLQKGYLDRAYKEHLQTIRQQYQGLANVTKDKPNLYFTVSQSIKTLDEIESILDRASRDIAQGRIQDVIDRYEATTARVNSLIERIVSQELLLVGKNERDYAESSDERQTAIRKQILQFAIAAVIMNALFSVWLAVFLIRNITSRLQIMSDNATKLAAEETLNKPLAGDDEIAELDHVFHRMADSLAEAARMKQELVSMLTHDLRSPLMAIQGSIDLIQKNEHAREESIQKLLSLANRNGNRMMNLIDDLLDIQKIKAGMMSLDKSSVCLAEIFEEVRLSHADWLEEYGIRLNIEDTALFFSADEKKLQRVIFNLISNAIKFSTKKGIIEVRASEAGENIEVTISDQGPGIPEEMLKTIFERFQQIDSMQAKDRVGSGLGLTVCQSIVELHGGKIWVESEVGKGSVFHFTLQKA